MTLFGSPENQENILKENIANPKKQITRTEIEKALLAGTNLKPDEITKATDETEAVLNEAIETMRIKDAALQQAAKALEEKKYKEAQEAADLTSFLLKNY